MVVNIDRMIFGRPVAPSVLRARASYAYRGALGTPKGNPSAQRPVFGPSDLLADQRHGEWKRMPNTLTADGPQNPPSVLERCP